MPPRNIIARSTFATIIFKDAVAIMSIVTNNAVRALYDGIGIGALPSL
jgi:hypothetical protein